LKEVGALVDLLVDEDRQKDVERAIVRAGKSAIATLEERLEAALPPLRARVLRVIGQFVHEAAARTLLLRALDDADPKTRRNAAMALGRADPRPENPPPRETEAALLRAWDKDPRVEMHRTIASSLGKIGSAASLSRLTEAGRSRDAELARIAQQAVMRIERTASRGNREPIAGARVPPRPVDVRFLCRRGLETWLADELSQVTGVGDACIDGAGVVRAHLRGPLDALLSARTMLEARFPLAAVLVREGEPVAEAVARAVTSEQARAILGTWSEESVRYRLEWVGEGHKRAATWETAQAIGRLEASWINDPTASSWGFLVKAKERSVDVELVPHGLADARFDYRQGDVPAASHPTIAAALARVGGARKDDVVWDPFVGSGSELVERALLGPFRSLTGTDLDARALATARANLAKARVPARLEHADALLFDIAPTLVITNPPMGRRASRTTTLRPMLDAFVRKVAKVLAPDGRFVWMAPFPRGAREAATQGGLRLAWAGLVDMDGFDAELQHWVRR